MGLIVDTVSEVVSITEENIDPAPSFKDGHRDTRYINGIGKTEDEVKILLDVSRLLESEVMEEIAVKA